MTSRLKMDLPELPKRLFTLGKEPEPVKIISYHTDDTKLYFAIRSALHSDKYQELGDSKLGVFLKFKELNFAWASRMIHFMLCFKLDIKKKYDLWCLVGPEPARFSLIEFEHLTGFNCDYVENLENLRCGCTMLCQNSELSMVIPYKTNRIHLYWLTMVAKDADFLKMPSEDR
ncbi:hypothetical protein N665_0071s0024 [Sinapis alba]|nr:hypothetical protein N665_0071s0024 [Sinapis alba]